MDINTDTKIITDTTTHRVVDIHSHILPFIDDGAKDLEQAVDMLLLSKKQGVDMIVATPHFYSGMYTIPEFLSLREKSYNALTEKLRAENIDAPCIVLGAEVEISPDILTDGDIGKLTINNSRYIMLEMPYATWQSWNYNVIMTVINKYKLIPVMAHIERFANLLGGFSKIETLVNMDVLLQINAYSLVDRRFKKIINSLVEKDKLHLLGSDCHNTDTRRSEMDRAIHEISKKYSGSVLNNIFKNSNKIIEDEI